MMTDEELMTQIDKVSGEFKGQLDDLYKVIGMIAMGRLYGWRVVRLVSTAGLWRKATELFGDLKEIMPERGRYAHKSIGLKIADEMGEYWDIVRGLVVIPKEERKKVS